MGPALFVSSWSQLLVRFAASTEMLHPLPVGAPDYRRRVGSVIAAMGADLLGRVLVDREDVSRLSRSHSLWTVLGGAFLHAGRLVLLHRLWLCAASHHVNLRLQQAAKLIMSYPEDNVCHRPSPRTWRRCSKTPAKQLQADAAIFGRRW